MPDSHLFSPAPASVPAPARALPLTFSGSGAEYFRIWIVNLLLTIVTFGIYSAWAKVRRLQYFDRNTALDGVAFDFDGNPVAILKGRIVALLLVMAYQFAFGFSVTAGLVVFGALMLMLPYLLRGALRFRLHNTYWRGMRFAFTGSSQGAYAAFLPPILMFMAPALAGGLLRRGDPQPPSPWFALFGLLYLAWPTLHAAVKRYQHGHIQYGGANSTYTLRDRSFWPPYLMALAIIVAPFIALGAVSIVFVPTHGLQMTPAVTFAPIALAYMVILSMIPFLQGRLHNLVWSHTGFPGLDIVSDMTFAGLFKLHAINTVLTIVTFGLFRPFAVVRAQRYVLAHLHITTSVDIDALIDASDSASVNAVGDGAADFLGVDFAL